MRDIINGSNPVMFVSSKVKDLCNSAIVGSTLSIECLEIDFDDSNTIMEIEIDFEFNGSYVL